LAIVVMFALLVPACGSDDDSGPVGRRTITVWSLESQPDRIAATERILTGFTRRTGIKVDLVGVDFDQLPTLVTSASASGDLPDVMTLPLSFAHGYAKQEILDTRAAAEVVDRLGADTFSEPAMRLVTVDGRPAGVPIDGWGQLLVYRKDLFDQAGLPAPDSLERIRAAAERLHRPGMAGIALSTDPGDQFTLESFEHIALAAGCQLADRPDHIALDSSRCVEAIRFYTDLAKNFSIQGNQDVDSTRGTYFAGRAAMVIWSPFILDEMAGLRADALPSCPQCREDRAFLARNSGVVTTIQGPTGPAQYGEVVSWGIVEGGRIPEAKRFVEYMLSDGYLGWIGMAPEGKYPLRSGDRSDPNRFTKAWPTLEAGVDEKAPLSRFYSEETLASVTRGVQEFQRWGFEQGEGELVTAQAGELPVPRMLSEVINGGTDPEDAAGQAQDLVQEIKDSLL
jgi:ABC-type glycerol-3-phosphate transport system substrate-binding protein